MIDVAKIKKEFPIFKNQGKKKLVFLDSGATSQKPLSVIEAMNDYYQKSNANIHRGVYELSVKSTQMVDEARDKVARFIGAKRNEVIFTRNASESINLVMYSWGKVEAKKGDRVVVSMLEHHSNMVTWQELCKEVGADLGVIKINKDGELVLKGGEVEREEGDGFGVITGSLESLLNERVKMVAFTGVSNVLGTITPVEEIVKMTRKKSPKAKILVDAAQLVPHMKMNVARMGADFVVFSSHKMLGPTGIGVLWGKQEVLTEMKPFMYGGDMISEVKITGASWADLPARFEAGTPDIAGIVGVGAAVDYLSNLGMDAVREHEKELVEYGLKKFLDLEKEGLITFYGPRKAENRGAVFTFNVEGVHAHDVATVLDNYGIAVRSGQHCAAPLVTSFGVMAMVRASFYVYNSVEDIDYLVDKIREVPKVFI